MKDDMSSTSAGLVARACQIAVAPTHTANANAMIATLTTTDLGVDCMTTAPLRWFAELTALLTERALAGGGLGKSAGHHTSGDFARSRNPGSIKAGGAPSCQEQRDTTGNERHDPDEIEVDPSSAQEADTDPIVDGERNGGDRGEHRGGMNGERGERERDCLGRQLRCRRGAHAEWQQRRHQHQTGAVRARHEERPHQEAEEAGLHPDARLLPMAVKRMPD